MDLFKLGLRNFFGVLIPGTIVIISVLYMGFSILLLINIKIPFTTFKDFQWLILIIIILFSYFVGSIIWHGAPTNLDIKSEKYFIKRNCTHNNGRKYKDLIGKIKKSLNAGKKPNPPDIKEIRMIKHIESFPYPVYMYLRFSQNYPPEILNFYLKCKMTDKADSNFFSYCKHTILHESAKKNGALSQEISYAEANSRLHAGLYYGLHLSIFFLIILFIIVIVHQILSNFNNLTVLAP